MKFNFDDGSSFPLPPNALKRATNTNPARIHDRFIIVATFIVGQF